MVTAQGFLELSVLPNKVKSRHLRTAISPKGSYSTVLGDFRTLRHVNVLQIEIV